MPARRPMLIRPVGLLAGVLADAWLGDPRRAHPVAAFGSLAGQIERRAWRDERVAGAVYCLTLVGVPVLLARMVERGSAGQRMLAVATGTWVVLGARSLTGEALAVQSHLTADDLRAARLQLTHLVGRRTDELDESGIARATIESVAENTSDAVVAPLFWGALCGLPGLLGYRAVNTLDAMVGHRNARFERFGWASARLDDAANLLPARLTAALTALVAPAARRREVIATVRRDGRRHPSPNAGLVEAGFAAALGVRLGGRNDYRSHVEHRPVLAAEHPAPVSADIGRAVHTCRQVTAAAALACAVLAAVLGRPR